MNPLQNNGLGADGKAPGVESGATNSGGPTQVDLDAPGGVVWIARILEREGFSTWAVGGAVRDALSGGRPQDWDLTTAARPREIQRIFRRTVPLGMEYGTVGVIAKCGRMYEVTTFRRDIETFGRRARVAFADSLEEDLERRDFTINAVAWHPLTKEVRDPHDGMGDLARGLLRTVGEPERRLEEDRLRALRALRFAGRFSLRIENGTWRAIQASSGHLGNLSAERIREELWKVIDGETNPSRSLRLYAESGVLRALYPELERCRNVKGPSGGGDLWEFLLRATDAAPARRPLVRLAVLLHGIGYSQVEGGGVFGDDSELAGRSAAMARGLLRRLRASNADVDRVTHLIAQHRPLPGPVSSDADLRRWIRRVGRDYLNDLFRALFAICRAHTDTGDEGVRELRRLRSRVAAICRSSAALTIGDLCVDGSDLRKLGIPPGPLYGEILRDLLDRVTEDPSLNDRARLLELVARGLTGSG
jgi:tRNA nucleotidyltransferase (CCA-adding enzyme)